ncbi:hypothetical protein ZYGR_0AD01580 [Zygosaccharomyces rouxii]|uniref:Mitochondrial 15S rRNA processing factor CCM1 n=2 Tax=Zygosaccharomyces rouxii TaxID=4956 RepID=CCM1_ZYGRC|nr:uncharacterized protein ZYRO0G09592g [Zygosaccharomyces rouxii]C5E042.1 RecName: Full=Mitochondrial group I intron splicing factor CCM1; Flags: Precursor [Zygosaccharomyces rouxii CBS 732]KAH9202471.1 mitochondrial group I intron splicing factor CCM1 [Zygosaccharomyces rouxii]GAV50975.1 hypothetical protein ZYGR_0AD01580 [Zygosaccharomyces rouxii]CAR29476.1 ZYRO0G09592p [Zygosaccharomyces rouxii]
MLSLKSRGSWNVLRWIQVPRRTAVIPAKPSPMRRKRRRIKNVSSKDLDLRGIDPQDSRALEFKVKQLQEFTRNLKEQFKLADSNTKKLEAEEELAKSIPEDDDKRADELFGKLEAPAFEKPLPQPNLSTLILSAENQQLKKLIPVEIKERINDDGFLLARLIDKDNQNWNDIISKLYTTEKRLSDISMPIISSGILRKVKNLSYENIEKLDIMLLETKNGDITCFNRLMYETLLLNLSNLRPPTSGEEDKVTMKMRQLLERYDKSKEISPDVPSKMTQFSLNCCLKYSTKSVSFENMEYFLSKFKNDYGITPNRENYTTVIQFYVKFGVSKQAWDVFDTMKFLSSSHAPDVTTYNSVLHLCNRERDYAKAIDLYEEMLDRQLQPSIQTLNIMAKTMARASADNVISEGKADSLRLLGWKYIHTLESTFDHTKHETHFYHTLEAMMALAAYDGDVGFARALYYKYTTRKYKEVVKYWKGKFDSQKIWQTALDPQLFNLLLLAYANFRPNKLPILLGYEKGIKLRRNILNSVDYAGRYDLDDEIKVQLPMLPISDMNQAWQILAESRALWQFNLEFGGYYDLRDTPEGFDTTRLQEMVSKSATQDELQFNILHQVSQWKFQLVNHSILNPKSLTTFLTIPIKNGDRIEFMLRLKEFTFQQNDLESRIEKLYKGLKLVESRVEPNSHERDLAINQIEMDENVKWFASMKHKIVAKNYIYELMMKAASAFKDSAISKDAWQSRGEYRKTKLFQQMDSKRRIESDTQFAALMVQFFARQNMLTDALAIVMSTRKFIDWKYHMVKGLHEGLVKLEDEKSISILLDIVNKKSSIELLDEKIRDFQL